MFKNILLAFFLIITSARANRLLEAEAALRAGAPLSDYQQFSGHPLYPYLQYEAYVQHGETTASAEIVTFLQQHARSPFAAQLAVKIFPIWLKNNQTDAILAAYSPHFASERCECIWRQALLATGKTAAAQKHIEELWLKDGNIDSACDPVFAHPNIKIPPALIAERFKRTLRANNLALAQYLTRLMTGSDQQAAQLWLSIRRRNEPIEKAFLLPQTWKSAILADGITRLASKDLTAATQLALEALRQNVSLEEDEALAESFNRLAAKLAQQDAPELLFIYHAIPRDRQQMNIVFDVIAHHLRTHKLSSLAPLLLDTLDAETLKKPEILYWIAKSFERSGHQEKADNYYRRAALERDFFGFLAAEKMKQSYRFNNKSLVKTIDYHRIMRRPETYRLKTFWQLGEKRRALQEFYSLQKQLTPEQLEQLALFADELGWSVQAVSTLAKTKKWDYLQQRFALHHQDLVRQMAKQLAISPAKIFAIMRKESIFQPEIKSAAGAIGLMQIMPATAHHTAKKHNIPYSGSASLIDPAVNIRLGSWYLYDCLNQFGHLAYAAAAYNAGPARVNKWLQERPNLPLDEWIAQIPFYETRDYVKQVLEYEKVYEYRLGLPVQPWQQKNIRMW